MLYSFRFFISWILAAIFMYVAFYAWHGLFLNDLSHIKFSKTLFLFLVALVYLVISFALYVIYQSKLLDKYVSNPLIKGVITGAAAGFVLFAFVTVLGISFTKSISLKYLIADCGWQMIEQTIGGVVIGFGKILIFEPAIEMLRRD